MGTSAALASAWSVASGTALLCKVVPPVTLLSFAKNPSTAIVTGIESWCQSNLWLFCVYCTTTVRIAPARPAMVVFQLPMLCVSITIMLHPHTVHSQVCTVALANDMGH